MLITEENFSGVVCRDSGFVQQITALDFYSAALRKNQ
jgi:hypothetical protein